MLGLEVEGVLGGVGLWEQGALPAARAVVREGREAEVAVLRVAVELATFMSDFTRAADFPGALVGQLLLAGHDGADVLLDLFWYQLVLHIRF